MIRSNYIKRRPTTGSAPFIMPRITVKSDESGSPRAIFLTESRTILILDEHPQKCTRFVFVALVAEEIRLVGASEV